jgi:hypothetical protein
MSATTSAARRSETLSLRSRSPRASRVIQAHLADHRRFPFSQSTVDIFFSGVASVISSVPLRFCLHHPQERP